MSETVNTDPLLNASEAASYLGMSERFVRRRFTDGTIPVVRLGRHLRVRQSTLEHYIEDASRSERTTRR